MSEYTPTTDEVETAFHEFASDLEQRYPGEYEHAPEFADWQKAKDGFRRWLAEERRTAAEKAWDEGLMFIYANAAVTLDSGIAPIENPYRAKETKA